MARLGPLTIKELNSYLGYMLVCLFAIYAFFALLYVQPAYAGFLDTFRNVLIGFLVVYFLLSVISSKEYLNFQKFPLLRLSASKWKKDSVSILIYNFFTQTHKSQSFKQLYPIFTHVYPILRRFFARNYVFISSLSCFILFLFVWPVVSNNAFYLIFFILLLVFSFLSSYHLSTYSGLLFLLLAPVFLILKQEEFARISADLAFFCFASVAVFVFISLVQSKSAEATSTYSADKIK